MDVVEVKATNRFRKSANIKLGIAKSCPTYFCKEKEIVWMISIYVNYAWQTLVACDEVLNVDNFLAS